MGQEEWSPHTHIGKPGQNSSGTSDPAALPSSPGAEAFSMDGPGVILSMPMSLGHWWWT